MKKTPKCQKKNLHIFAVIISSDCVAQSIVCPEL